MVYECMGYTSCIMITWYELDYDYIGGVGMRMASVVASGGGICGVVWGWMHGFSL